MRIIRPRFDVVRNGVKVTELTPSGTPSCTFSAESAIKSSFRGTFLPNESVNWLIDEIHPVVEIDGTEISYGVYLPATINENIKEGISTVSVEAYDRSWLVQSVKTESVLHLPAGSNYVDIIRTMLTEIGISLILPTVTGYTLREDREDWDIGTDYLTIINQLLDEINYNELWFDQNGYAVIEPEQNTTAANIECTYNSNDPNTLVRRESSIKIDLYGTPNVFVCICDNPDDDSTMISTAVNNNPLSPVSIVRRGHRIVEVYKLDNIASQTELDTYAKLLAMESMFVGENVTVSTGIQKPVRLNASVALVMPGTQGICKETGYTVNFKAGGKMTHRLEKLMEVS